MSDVLRSRIKYGMVFPADLRKAAEVGGARAAQLWAVLCTYAPGGAGATHPHQDTLAEMCACDVRTVQRTMTILENAGMITKEPRLNGGRKVGNIYTLEPTPYDTSVVDDLPTDTTPVSPTDTTPLSDCFLIEQTKEQTTPASGADTTVKKQKRRTRVPDLDTLRSLMSEKEREEWVATFADPRHELNQFRDNHLARGTTMLDWRAALRTWCGRGKEWTKNKPKADEPLDWAEQLVAIQRRQ